MPFYVQRGSVPHKRHTQFRKPDGTLYREEVFGTKGFSGVQSILYHVHAPTAVRHVEGAPSVLRTKVDDSVLRHRHFRTSQLDVSGDAVTGRVMLLGNEDVHLGSAIATQSMPCFYKNAAADELFFVHEGRGTLHSVFGELEMGPGDYIVIPAGTIYNVHVHSPLRMLVIESQSPIEFPKRYRNEYGQLLEHSPYCERDIRVPELTRPMNVSGQFRVLVQKGHERTVLTLAHHPYDVVGWDGCVYPYALSIEDFEPITGRIHQPPPVHQTFSGHNFVVCSFVPRLFDYHPESIPTPYNHSNIDSDEVLYYVRGNFMSRKGIEEGSITLHPSGIPHGPHPGTVEASLGKDLTEELAVMVDTFRPLHVLSPAIELEDTNYMYSWL